MKFYFTFGFGQVHEGCFTVIEAKGYNEARENMVDRYGIKWSMQYDEKGWVRNGVSQQEEYGLKEIK